MYQCALNAFVRFLRRNKIDINEITSRVVKQFITFLENEKPRAGHKKRPTQSVVVLCHIESIAQCSQSRV